MNISEYFELIPIVSAVFWLLIIVGIASAQSSHSENLPHKKYFLPHFFFKLIMAIAFAMIYLIYYQGGDTVAYWAGAMNLNNMLFDSPGNYIVELFTESKLSNMGLRFNPTTGYPPGWIYREHESFAVSKILSLFSIITFKSYLATTVILAYISTIVTWRFFETILRMNLHQEKILAYGLLFFPSVAFWCSGISKDTVVFLALLYMVRNTIELYYDFNTKTRPRIIGLIICILIIFSIRQYILIATIPAILLSSTVLINKVASDNSMKKMFLKSLFYIGGAGFIFLYSQLESSPINAQAVVDEIVVIQQDFANNSIYGTGRYDLGISEFSNADIAQTIPSAIIAAIYRPFLWEALSPLLIFNGLESFILILLTLRFFLKNFGKKITYIRNNQFLVFSIVFILIMGFSIGFTSGLYGVLVRLKTVIMPFTILLLTLQFTKEINSKKSNSGLS